MPSTSASAVRIGIMRTVDEDARGDEPADGRDRHRAQSVHLLGHRHRAELGRDARADAAADHEGRQHGPELAHERERHDASDEELSAERRERVRRLEREHAAREERGQSRDRDRLDAELVHLSQHVVAVERPGEHRRDRVAGQLRHAAQVLEHALALAAESVHEAQAPDVPVEQRRRRRLRGRRIGLRASDHEDARLYSPGGVL